MTTTQILDCGAVPPSQLKTDYKGVCTVTSRTNEASTVRMSHVPPEVVDRWFDLLPQVRSAIPETDTAVVLEPAGIPAQELPATAAVLYAQGIELIDILSRPDVHEELRHLAKLHRHPTGEPIVARVTRELLGIGKTDATSGRSDGSGQAKMLVSETLVDLGLLIKPTVEAQPAGLTISG